MAETDPRVSAWRQGVGRLAQLRSLESCLPFLARPMKSTGVKVAAHCLKPRCKSDALSWVQNPHYLSHADSNGKLELWRHLVKCDWTKDKNVKHVAGCDAGLIGCRGSPDTYLGCASNLHLHLEPEFLLLLARNYLGFSWSLHSQ